MTRQLMVGALPKGMLSFERASDVMTQTRLRQTGMVDDFEDFLKGKSRCS